MRITVGAIMHESHDFPPLLTDLSAFREVDLLCGVDIIAEHANRKTEIGGVLRVAQTRGIEVVPTVSATALPSGMGVLLTQAPSGKVLEITSRNLSPHLADRQMRRCW